MAEAILTRQARDAGINLTVDSCGTSGMHAGQSAHPETLRVLREHGIEYHGLARQVNENDVQADHLICMDRENQRTIEQRFGITPRLLLDTDVPDPYFTGDFSGVYDLIEEGCAKLLEQIKG